MRIVVDASVAIKWYVHEPHTAAASQLLDPRFELVVPDLLWAEFGNILWKKHLRGDVTAGAARQIVGELKRVAMRTEPVAPLLGAAFEIAMRIRRTVYDSTYLALAERLGCSFVTADEKLYNSIQADRIAAHALWVEDLP